MPGRYTPPTKHDFVELAHGVVVERDVLNVVQKISEYDPNLGVKYLDPEKADSPFDAPYLIVEHCPDGVERVVTSVWELNDTVVDTLKHIDLARHIRPQDFLAEMDRQNKKVKEAQEKKRADETEAIGGMIADVLRSPKDTYTATDPVSGKDYRFTATPQEKKRGS